MIYQITLNHYNAAVEHIKENNIPYHKPTMFQAFRITLYDLLFNKTIYNKKYKAHLVYEVIKYPTMGMRMANIIRIYVPKEHRGNGVASKLINSINEKYVISGKGEDHEEVGRLYRVRTNI